ncbi:unnamed protein product [Miscanthus lutarioriparius]|uniref:DUF7769 domain-containing protein n=1 Tax=Miscanthus lutarioriparius TaxID=422564 RepID=A0A811QED1_9POAL|nr:unnamed protein product [Miscanthus lutarioriparius]
MSLQQDQLYEDEAHLQDQHGHLLPDLNENPVYEQENEIAHLQEDQLYEDEAHLHVQPVHLDHNERLGLHVIDLNVAGSEGEQEHHKGMMEDMHDYGVYADAVDIVFDEEELEGSDVEEDHHANENNAHQSRNLTEAERQQIYATLLERSDHGRLKRKATTIVAQMF